MPVVSSYLAGKRFIIAIPIDTDSAFCNVRKMQSEPLISQEHFLKNIAAETDLLCSTCQHVKGFSDYIFLGAYAIQFVRQKLQVMHCWKAADSQELLRVKRLFDAVVNCLLSLSADMEQRNCFGGYQGVSPLLKNALAASSTKRLEEVVHQAQQVSDEYRSNVAWIVKHTLVYLVTALPLDLPCVTGNTFRLLFGSCAGGVGANPRFFSTLSKKLRHRIIGECSEGISWSTECPGITVPAGFKPIVINLEAIMTNAIFEYGLFATKAAQGKNIKMLGEAAQVLRQLHRFITDTRTLEPPLLSIQRVEESFNLLSTCPILTASGTVGRNGKYIFTAQPPQDAHQRFFIIKFPGDFSYCGVTPGAIEVARYAQNPAQCLINNAGNLRSSIRARGILGTIAMLEEMERNDVIHAASVSATRAALSHGGNIAVTGIGIYIIEMQLGNPEPIKSAGAAAVFELVRSASGHLWSGSLRKSWLKRLFTGD